MSETHLIVAWIGIGLGILSGALLGLAFHHDAFAGGYGSWRRRLMRLGHIAFFGIGLLNLGYGLMLKSAGWPAPAPWASWALIGANAGMPLVCFLSAWRKSFRWLFPLPVAAVLVAVVALLLRRFGL